MKSINESSMLIAKALHKLRYYVTLVDGDLDICREVEEAIVMLDSALEKLVEGS